MQLSSLMALETFTAAAGLDINLPDGAGEALAALEITGITADSRQVAPGNLFVAIPGTLVDGAGFIGKAVAAGAVAVLAAQDATISDPGVPLLRSNDPRRALALMAARFYQRQPRTIIAITGTSGKTSVAEFTRQLFAALGKRAASLGTIGLVKPDGGIYGTLTTPDPVTLARTLAELADEGVTHLALEASSHGLDQSRLDGARIAIAAFTNLGRDHLDYHTDVEAYLNAKLRLFDKLLDPASGIAVINADGDRAADAILVAKARRLKLLTVGAAGDSLRLVDTRRDGFAQLLTIESDGIQRQLRLPLIGEYQASNALLAAGLVVAAGEAPAAAIAAMSGIKGVRGRLEIIGEARGGLAVVDYAHKPEALAEVLAALRPFVTGKLICVFGCGGDRDRGKRPLMAAIAVKAADVVIVTDDNPRSEAPAAIRAEIMAAAKGAREIGDRGEAIAAGVAMLGEGDVLVVAGKGHETGQIVGDKLLPFSDHEAVAAALAEVN